MGEELLHVPDRLLSPLVRDRKDEELRPVSRAEALNRIAAKLEQVASESGPCLCRLKNRIAP